MSNRAHRFHAPMIVYFDAIRRAGSVREAARRLNVASSAVNRQLLKLEDELGTPLFDRLPSGLKLTHAGATFARHAIEVLQDAERVRSELEAMQGLRSGHIEIAAVEALTSGLLPNVLLQLRERHPRITVGVSVLGSAAISAAVIGGDADMGIAFGVDRTSDLRQMSHSRLPLGATMRPDHPLTGNKSLTLAMCLSHSLILPKADLSIRQQLQRALGKLPQGAVETSSVELAKQLTMRGLGISFQTRIGIEDEIERGELVHIPIARPAYLQADLGIYVRSARNPPIAVHALVDLLNAALARCATVAGEAEPAAPLSST